MGSNPTADGPHKLLSVGNGQIHLCSRSSHSCSVPTVLLSISGPTFANLGTNAFDYSRMQGCVLLISTADSRLHITITCHLCIECLELSNVSHEGSYAVLQASAVASELLRLDIARLYDKKRKIRPTPSLVHLAIKLQPAVGFPMSFEEPRKPNAVQDIRYNEASFRSYCGMPFICFEIYSSILEKTTILRTVQEGGSESQY